MTIMTNSIEKDVQCFMTGLVKRNPGETEFHQALREVVEQPVLLVRVRIHREGLVQHFIEERAVLLRDRAHLCIGHE